MLPPGAHALDASSYRTYARARIMQVLTLLSVWPWPMGRSCAKPLSPSAPAVNWRRLPRHTLCTAAAPHPPLQSVASVGLQLAQIAVNCNPTEKALLADVLEGASYVKLLRTPHHRPATSYSRVAAQECAVRALVRRP